MRTTMSTVATNGCSTIASVGVSDSNIPPLIRRPFALVIVLFQQESKVASRRMQ